MTCCTNISDLGCAYSCDIIQIGVNTPTTGSYTIELQPDGVKVVTTANTAGTPLVFAAGYLNEDATHVFKIIKPDGTYYETADDEDCFRIEIKPTTNAALANLDITPLDCTCDYDVYINSVFSQTVTLTNCADLTINIV